MLFLGREAVGPPVRSVRDFLAIAAGGATTAGAGAALKRPSGWLRHDPLVTGVDGYGLTLRLPASVSRLPPFAAL
jgi:hypothetical protein